jgi:hypothetical protein
MTNLQYSSMEIRLLFIFSMDHVHVTVGTDEKLQQQVLQTSVILGLKLQNKLLKTYLQELSNRTTKGYIPKVRAQVTSLEKSTQHPDTDICTCEECSQIDIIL